MDRRPWELQARCPRTAGVFLYKYPLAQMSTSICRLRRVTFQRLQGRFFRFRPYSDHGMLSNANVRFNDFAATFLRSSSFARAVSQPPRARNVTRLDRRDPINKINMATNCSSVGPLLAQIAALRQRRQRPARVPGLSGEPVALPAPQRVAGSIRHVVLPGDCGSQSSPKRLHRRQLSVSARDRSAIVRSGQLAAAIRASRIRHRNPRHHSSSKRWETSRPRSA